jgi:hypothetical protein
MRGNHHSHRGSAGQRDTPTPASSEAINVNISRIRHLNSLAVGEQGGIKPCAACLTYAEQLGDLPGSSSGIDYKAWRASEGFFKEFERGVFKLQRIVRRVSA